MAQVQPVNYVTAESMPTSIAFLDNGDKFAIGDVHGSLALWNLKSWKLATTKRLSSKSVSWMIKIGENRVLIQCRTEFPKLYSVVGDGIDLIKEFNVCNEIHEGFCKGKILGSVFAFAVGQSNLAVVDKVDDDWRLKCILTNEKKTDSGLITCVAFVTPGEILTGYECGEIQLWNVETREILSSLNVSPMTPLDLDFDRDKKYGISGGNEGYVLSFKLCPDTNKLSVVKKREFVQNCGKEGISSLEIRHPIVAAGGWDSTVKLFSWMKPEKLKPLGALKFHADSVETLLTSCEPIKSKGNQRLLAVAAKDKKISFWSIYNC